MAASTPAKNLLAALHNSELRARYVLAAIANLGTPYVWGGDLPASGGGEAKDDGGAGSKRLGLDCSGLVIECLQMIGLAGEGVDATAADMERTLPSTTTPMPGDLAFYGDGAVTHVAIVLSPHFSVEAGGGRYVIEAAGGGSETKSVKAARARQAEVRCGRDRRTPLGFGYMGDVFAGRLALMPGGFARAAPGQAVVAGPPSGAHVLSSTFRPDGTPAPSPGPVRSSPDKQRTEG